MVRQREKVHGSGIAPSAWSLPRSTFVRFVTGRLHKDSQFEEGIFVAAFRLRREGRLADYEEDLLRELFRWFHERLEKPAGLSRSTRPRRKRKAVSWLKSSAKEHLGRIREMAAILENHGMVVRMIKTERPGYIVYGDEFQITAEPFADVNF